MWALGAHNFGDRAFKKPMNEIASIDEFLAACVRACRAGEDAPWTLSKTMVPAHVWERIEFHGIAFLLNALEQHLTGWPQALIERLAEEARLIALWEATHQKSVSQVIEALAEAGIESVVMKGTALAYAFHAEPATRRRGDTDLLVQPKDQARTRAILKELGWYRKDDPHGLYYQEGWLHDAAGFFIHAIDLHWEPSDRPVLQPVLPIEAFFDGKQPMPALHARAFRPDPALMIVHATINQKWHAVHGYDTDSGRLAAARRLIWSVDFDLLCRSMEPQDWARLQAHCKAHAVGPLVAEALSGMAVDLHCAVPDGVLAELDAVPMDETLIRYFANPDSLTQFWIDLKRAHSWEQKRRLLATRAFPPREHLLEKYPGATSWPTALLQGRMLVETAGRALRKVSQR